MNKTQTKFLIIGTCCVLAACGSTPPAEKPVAKTESTLQTNPLQDKPNPFAAFKANLELQTDKSNSKTGEKIAVTILVSNAQEPITTANADLKFDPELLQVAEIDSTKSAFPVMFANEFDNAKGSIAIHRSSTKGVTGEKNVLATVVFEAKNKGEAKISFDTWKTALLLKNNAFVTPDQKNFPTLSLTLQ